MYERESKWAERSTFKEEEGLSNLFASSAYARCL